MNIMKEPAQYQAAFGDVLYHISGAEPEQRVEVAIMNDNGSQVIGRKRLRGESEYEINVANYLQQQLEILPLDVEQTQISSCSSRNVHSQIIVDGDIFSSRKTLTAGAIDTPVGEFMTDAPDMRPLATDEFEELSVCIPASGAEARVTMFHKSGAYTMEIIDYTAGYEVAVLELSMQDLDKYLHANYGYTLSDCSHIELEAYLGAEDKALYRTYQVVPPNPYGVRICWLNRRGGIDYYTFATETGRNLTVGKDKIYSQNGYRVVGIQSQSVRRLVSQYEPQRVMEWIGEIACSPKVWIYEDGKHWQADVITSEVQTRSNHLMQLTLEVRYALNTNYQRF